MEEDALKSFKHREPELYQILIAGNDEAGINVHYSSPTNVSTDINPVDIGTLPISVQDLIASKWTTVPDFLYQDNIPEFLQDAIPAVKIMRSTTAVNELYEDIHGCRTWARMIRAKLLENDTLDEKRAADLLILEAQTAAFPKNLPVAM